MSVGLEKLPIRDSISRPLDPGDWYGRFVGNVRRQTGSLFKFRQPGYLALKLLASNERIAVMKRAGIDKMSIPVEEIPASFFTEPIPIVPRRLKITEDAERTQYKSIKATHLWLQFEPNDDVLLERLSFQEGILPANGRKSPWVEEFGCKVELATVAVNGEFLNAAALSDLFSTMPPAMTLLPAGRDHIK
jgi:hypothetical protein